MTRRPSGQPAEVNLNAIVTPMLDTCFQLLFFFIVMYRPHALEGQLIFRLPDKAEHKGLDALQSNPKIDIEPLLEAELTILAKTQHDGIHDGIISQLSVLQGGKETLIPNQLTGEPDLRALLDHLRKVREKLSNQDDIKVQGDGRLKWDGMMRVVDVCLKAGFTSPAFQPPPDAAPGTP